MPRPHVLVSALLMLPIAGRVLAQAPIPLAQGWAGWAHCQITITAPGYSHSESHLWTIRGAGIKQANMEIYPATWTVTGAGSLQRTTGPTTVTAQWQGGGKLENVEIGFTLHLNRITFQRWTGHGPARSAYAGAETRTINGNSQTRALVLDVQQWTFPAGEDATTSTHMTGSKTTPFDGARGPMAPGGVGAAGTATCMWDLVRGGTPSVPPSPAAVAPTSTGSAATPTAPAGANRPPAGTAVGRAGSVGPGSTIPTAPAGSTTAPATGETPARTTPVGPGPVEVAAEDPGSLTARQVANTEVLLTWSAVPGVSSYMLRGPGRFEGQLLSGGVTIAGTSAKVVGVPAGTQWWTVASVYPGGVRTAADKWPRVALTVLGNFEKILDTLKAPDKF